MNVKSHLHEYLFQIPDAHHPNQLHGAAGASCQPFYESLSFYACTVSNFEQFILADFIKNGYFEKHINRMRLFYARKRRALIDAVKTAG